MYVVDRDFGFAPNPFHGYCSLATCKPKIRRVAEVNDWVVGMGGLRLQATGRCVFAMRVTEKVTFDQYWTNHRFLDKKPVRNGSRKMMVGDNIYYKDANENWLQADSHHSNPDGSINSTNLQKDTGADAVLLSQHFFYFGKSAPNLPEYLLRSIGYKNQIGHRVFESNITNELIEWIHNSFRSSLNLIVSDPFNFNDSEKRYLGDEKKLYS